MLGKCHPLLDGTLGTNQKHPQNLEACFGVLSYDLNGTWCVILRFTGAQRSTIDLCVIVGQDKHVARLLVNCADLFNHVHEKERHVKGAQERLVRPTNFADTKSFMEFRFSTNGIWRGMRAHTPGVHSKRESCRGRCQCRPASSGRLTDESSTLGAALLSLAP